MFVPFVISINLLFKKLKSQAEPGTFITHPFNENMAHIFILPSIFTNSLLTMAVHMIKNQ